MQALPDQLIQPLHPLPPHCLCTSARPSFFYFLSFVIYFVRTSARLFVLLSLSFSVRPSVCHLSYFSSSVRFPVFIFFPLSKYIPVRLSACQSFCLVNYQVHLFVHMYFSPSYTLSKHLS